MDETLWPIYGTPPVRPQRPDSLLGIVGDRSGVKKLNKPLPTRARAILTLELRGINKKDIAKRLNMHYNSVLRLTLTDRYLRARNAYLDRMDEEFMAMKPLVFEALRTGLLSAEETTALKASEQWMRAAGFMHHGDTAKAVGPVSAEDVARQMLHQVNVQVNVNTSHDAHAHAHVETRAEEEAPNGEVSEGK